MRINGLFIAIVFILNCAPAQAVPLTGNSEPVITSVPGSVATVAHEYKYVVTAEDHDGDPITISVLEAPSAAAWNPQTNTLTWTPSVTEIGEAYFLVQASDGVGEPAKQKADIQPGSVVEGLLPGDRIDWTKISQHRRLRG